MSTPAPRALRKSAAVSTCAATRRPAARDRIDAVEDTGLEDAFPAHFGSWVELTTQDGETRRSDVLDSFGTPARPIPDDGLRAKFESLTQTAMPGLDPQAVYAAVDGFDRLADPAALTRLFAAR